MLMDKGSLKEKNGFPGKPTSVWLDTTSKTHFGEFSGRVNVDVAVIGGGIAGLMTAHSLIEAGFKVAVVEAGRIVEDVTAYTTAKVTSQHGAIYSYLIKNIGEEKAKMYADANQACLMKIVSIILENKIECELRKQNAYIYTEKTKNIELLKKEAESARRLGISARYTEDTLLDFIKGAVEVKNQAQFHPRKFLLELARIISAKAQIFENTRALSIKEGNKCTVITNKGEIEAKKVVVTTHFPFYDKDRFYTKLFPHRSYVLGLHLKSEVPEGLYFSIDGERNSIRNQGLYGKKILLVGGGTEKVGEDADTYKYYKKVEEYAKQRFEIEKIEYHWFTQDNRTPDRVPYIGKMANTKNVYVATGFGGWGMTTSAVSAMIISDLIAKRINVWTALFDPSRSGLSHALKSYMSENAKTVKHVLGKRVQRHPFELPTGFEPGEGKIINLRGRKIAVYKDKKGKIFAVSPVCTHMGCTVNWNATEKTWDCPCHGSRYNYDGKVIHGPALYDLKKEDI